VPPGGAPGPPSRPKACPVPAVSSWALLGCHYLFTTSLFVFDYCYLMCCTDWFSLSVFLRGQSKCAHFEMRSLRMRVPFLTRSLRMRVVHAALFADRGGKHIYIYIYIYIVL